MIGCCIKSELVGLAYFLWLCKFLCISVVQLTLFLVYAMRWGDHFDLFSLQALSYGVIFGMKCGFSCLENLVSWVMSTKVQCIF